jgi:glycosyltransferase involved in cell wall biosynthesis
MLNQKKIVVVMPAYNAETTLRKTYAEIRQDVVDEIILVDDESRDRTAEVARSLGVKPCGWARILLSWSIPITSIPRN